MAISLYAQLSVLGFIKESSYLEYKEFREYNVSLLVFEFLITDYLILPSLMMIKDK